MVLPKQTPRVKAGERFLSAPSWSVPELLGPLELRDGNLGDSNQSTHRDWNHVHSHAHTPPAEPGSWGRGAQPQEPTHGGFLIDMSQWGSHIEFCLPRSHFCSSGFGYDLMHKNMLLSLCYANYGTFLEAKDDKGKWPTFLSSWMPCFHLRISGNQSPQAWQQGWRSWCHY